MDNEFDNEQQPGMDEDYIETIKKMKENSVPKAEYEKLKAENKRLLEGLLEFPAEGQEAQPEEETDLQELRKSLFDSDNNNVQYAEKALKLRDELIKRGSPDPFLPVGHQISPLPEDVEAAERVANVLKHCVDYSEGDNEVFTNELQRLTNDSMPHKFRR